MQAKTIELGFPDLEHRIKVTLPDDFDSAKKYPALIYYHGQGGKPDTSLMRNHVDGRQWIVVGMTYYQQGRLQVTKDELGKEMTLLRSVRRYLEEKYSMDKKRCYVAGFSKGGWMTDILLQAVPDLAGGVILGAGHLYEVNPGRARKYSNKKPIFIGVGRLDVNYFYGLKAVVFHRKLGARTTFEEWAEINHTMPREGSTALQQWFVLQTNPVDKVSTVAAGEMQQELSAALKLEPYAQWMKIRQLKSYPYAKLAGEKWNKEVSEKMATLEKSDPVKAEFAVLRQHRKLLFQEITDPSLAGLKKANAGYMALVSNALASKQAKLIQADYQRTQRMIAQYKEQKAAGDEGKGDPFAPIKPNDPERKRRIPGNPLAR